MKTVLHIENDPDCLELSRIVLERNGYKYLSASSSAFGLLLAEQEKLDLIIVSDQLPTQTGLDVVEKLQDSPLTENTPLVFFCGVEEYRSLQEQMEDQNGSSVGYIAKPTTYQDFLEGIQDALDPH